MGWSITGVAPLAAMTGASIPPKRIMLATDLSSRGDRALNRAIQLANTWQAELLIVYALEAESIRRAPVKR